MKKLKGRIIPSVLPAIFLLSALRCDAQSGTGVVWDNSGNSYYQIKNAGIVNISLPDNKETLIASKNKLQVSGKSLSGVESFTVSNDNKTFLLFMKAKKVWNYKTRGDYWVYQLKDSSFFSAGCIITRFLPDVR